MSVARLHMAVKDLPYSLKEQVIGFATYVDDASDDLLDAIGIHTPTRGQVDQLAYAAGIWRLWQIINSQLSLLDNSLALLQSATSPGMVPPQQDIGYLLGEISTLEARLSMRCCSSCVLMSGPHFPVKA